MPGLTGLFIICPYPLIEKMCLYQGNKLRLFPIND